jgi:transposase-like protein
MSRRHDEAARRRIVERWERSGLPARRFAARAGVSPWTLYKWRRALRHGAAGFVELISEEPVRPARGELDAAIEITLPGGTVVRVGRGVSEAWLRRVVVTLASSA